MDIYAVILILLLKKSATTYMYVYVCVPLYTDSFISEDRFLQGLLGQKNMLLNFILSEYTVGPCLTLGCFSPRPCLPEYPHNSTHSHPQEVLLRA